MKIKKAELKDKNHWNNFVIRSKYGSFLQSWEWGEFQESLGNKVFRIQITDDQNQIVGVILLVKHRLPKNLCWLYSPRGPVFGLGNWDLKIGQNLRQYLEAIARNEKAIFLKIEPKIEKQPNQKIPEGFVKLTSVQPQNTLILNLEKSESAILSKMHPKTRYNIKLSERRGVTTRISDNSREDIQVFYEMLKETALKNKIKIFPFRHYQKLIKTLSRPKNKIVKLFIAEYKKKPVAGIIVSFFGKEANYLHGASLYNFRQLMAPHQLQWQAILEAKKHGCTEYDLWGIAPENKPNHKWAGITRFKKGFGGRPVEYLGGLDIVYSPIWYKLYKAVTFLRRI